MALGKGSDAAELLQVDVSTATGERVSLGSLVKAPINLLVFLRHFGCIGCSEHIRSLEPRLGELEQLGVSVLLIGSGRPEHIEDFIERHHLADKSVTLVSDPELASYERAGLERSAWSAMRPRAWAKRLQGFARGTPSYFGSGDSKQQGGTLVIDGEGRVQFIHRSEAVGDNADLSDVVDTVLTMAATASEEGLV